MERIITRAPLPTPERFARAVAMVPKDREEAFQNAIKFMLAGVELADRCGIQPPPPATQRPAGNA